jgi:hypothetical protein
MHFARDYLRRVLRCSLVGLVLAVLTSAGEARAQDYAPFIGEYVGQAVFSTPKGLSKRDLDVVIRRETEGFSVEWTTDTQRPNGRIKSDRYFVAFKATPRPGFYLPTNKIDRYGQSVAIDPLKGDPQLIARIQGQTFTVFATILEEDGTVQTQAYDRTLVPGGMKLTFKSVRNGRPQKDIKADLKLKEQSLNVK